MKFLRFILPFLFACGLHAQTTLFTNIQVNGTETIPSAGNITLLSGSTLTFDIAGTTNSLLYITNGSGNVGALGLGAGLSVSGGNLVAGSSTSANPSALVGTSAINGSATSFMRSDAAPAINTAMSPTWTGVHQFDYTAVQTNPVKEFGVQVNPTLNQRNNAIFSLYYGNETITQAGTGQQDLIDLEIGLAKKFEVDSTGAEITGSYKASVIGSVYGGTGTGSFAQGSMLVASAANTWSTLADGTANYILTASGAGTVPSYQPLTTLLDTIGSPAQGDFLERGASAWQYIAPGTSGQVLATQGAGADPHWVNASTPPGSTTQHDVASYSNTVGGLEDLGAIVEGTVTSSVTSTDNDTNGTWKVVNNSNVGSGSSAYGQTIYAPNLGGSGGVGEIDLVLGVGASGNNMALWGFNYTASGSTSNFMDWGFPGHLNLARLSIGGTFTATNFVGTLGTGTASSAAVTTESLTGKVTTYNNIATAGWGVPAIQGFGRSVAQTAAVSSVATYTVGAADGSFEVSANVNVTTSTLHTFTVTCSYTDETSASQTLTLGFTQLAGATVISSITNATGTGPYEGLSYHIRCKAATPIVIATTGTFTTVTYNVEGWIVQKG